MYPVTGPAIAPQLRIAILGEGIVLDIQHKSPGMGVWSFSGKGECACETKCDSE